MSSTATFGGWSRRIGDVAEIPPPFLAAFEATGLGARGFPLVLFSPPFRFDRYENTPKLLLAARDRLVCLEDRAGVVHTTELHRPALHAIEWGRQLLNAWLVLQAEGPGGAVKLRVDFNAASRDVYLPLLTELRREWYAEDESDYARELAKLDALQLRDFKLMNLGRQALLEGAEVRSLHLQPALKGPLDAGADVTGTLAILTQRELVLVSEGDEEDVGAYAATWRYLPLERIVRLEVEPVAGRPVLALRVVLPGGAANEAEFARESEAELRAFADAIARALPSTRAA